MSVGKGDRGKAELLSDFDIARRGASYRDFLTKYRPLVSELTIPDLQRVQHACRSEGLIFEERNLRQQIGLRLEHMRKNTTWPQDFFVFGLDWTGALGHHVVLERYFRLQQMSILPSGTRVVLQRPATSPNPELFKFVTNGATVVRGSSKLMQRLHTQFLPVRCDMSATRLGKRFLDSHEISDIAEWEWYDRGNAAARLTNQRIIERAMRVLRGWGLRDGDWFVAFHVRSGNTRFDSTLNNAEISTYLPAMKMVTDCGGWVIRMGNTDMPPLPLNLPNTVDYAHAIERSPWLDMYLWSHARFAVGTNSGGTEPFHLFGVPTLRTNCNNYPTQYFVPRSVLLPKLFRRPGHSRAMSMEETVASPWCWSETSVHKNFPADVLDNSPEDIRNGLVELMNSSGRAGSFLELDEDQRRFQEIRLASGRKERLPIARSFLHAHSFFV